MNILPKFNKAPSPDITSLLSLLIGKCTHSRHYIIALASDWSKIIISTQARQWEARVLRRG